MPSEATLTPGRNVIFVRLLYAAPLHLDEAVLQRQFSQHGARVTPRDAHGVIGVRGPASLELVEGRLPASLAITTGPSQAFEPIDFRQSFEWGYQEASRIAGQAHFEVTLSELTSMMLDTADRIEHLLQSVASVARAYPPLALHWVRHERFDEPTAFIDRVTGADRGRLLLNVRRFKLASGELVMDTLGLGLLGLLDLQLHFRQLDQSLVSEYLYGLGGAQLRRGPSAGVQVGSSLEEGTIVGPDGAPATCRYEMAIAQPTRGVVDIEPSPAFSARNS